MEHFTPVEIRAIAEAEMSKHGLTQRGWTFVIDNTNAQRNGQCRYIDKEIAVSLNRIRYDAKELVVRTLRHEIAHALHYYHYVDSGRRADYSAQRWTGKRWVRKVAPHGAEWKRFAIIVGVDNPTASNTSNVTKMVIQRWRAVIVDRGTVEDAEFGYSRFPKRMSSRYLRGRKNLLGKLFLVRGSDWEAYLAGRKTVNQMSFYQDHPHPVSHGIAGLLI